MADDERDLNAAERALGTEAPGTENARDRQAREGWEQRLAPLLETVAPVEPPEGIYERILDRIAIDDMRAELTAARRRVSRWKRVAMLAGSAAAAIAIYVAVDIVQPPPAQRYVAVVRSDSDGSPGLIVQFDTGTGVATIVPVGIPVPANRSLEMWHLPAGADRPYSLGLLPDNPNARQNLEAGPGDIFAVSLEPAGGSPTGQPTEAIYHGRIVPIE